MELSKTKVLLNTPGLHSLVKPAGTRFAAIRAAGGGGGGESGNGNYSGEGGAGAGGAAGQVKEAIIVLGENENLTVSIGAGGIGGGVIGGASGYDTTPYGIPGANGSPTIVYKKISGTWTTVTENGIETIYEQTAPILTCNGGSGGDKATGKGIFANITGWNAVETYTTTDYVWNPSTGSEYVTVTHAGSWHDGWPGQKMVLGIPENNLDPLIELETPVNYLGGSGGHYYAAGQNGINGSGGGGGSASNWDPNDYQTVGGNGGDGVVEVTFYHAVNEPIALSEIISNFNGTSNNLSDYYRGGPFVPDIGSIILAHLPNVKNQKIRFSDFIGTKIPPPTEYVNHKLVNFLNMNLDGQVEFQIDLLNKTFKFRFNTVGVGWTSLINYITGVADYYIGTSNYGGVGLTGVSIGYPQTTGWGDSTSTRDIYTDSYVDQRDMRNRLVKDDTKIDLVKLKRPRDYSNLSITLESPNIPNRWTPILVEQPTIANNFIAKFQLADGPGGDANGDISIILNATV